VIDDRLKQSRGRSGADHLVWIQALLANAVPLIGHWGFGWALSTTVALYWCENVLGSLFVFARLLIHHRLTHDPSYEHNQLGISASGFGARGGKIRRFIPEFGIGATVFTAAHGLFLLILTKLLLPPEQQALDGRAFQHGLLALLALLSLHFLFDLRSIGRQPFSWARNMASAALARIVVLHLTIVVGGGLLILTQNVTLFFASFSILKLGGDVVSAIRMGRATEDSKG
jgi:hypothetical protein